MFAVIGEVAMDDVGNGPRTDMMLEEWECFSGLMM